MVKIVCEICGELPYPLPLEREKNYVEAIAKFKKTIKLMPCGRCGARLRLEEGEQKITPELEAFYQELQNTDLLEVLKKTSASLGDSVYMESVLREQLAKANNFREKASISRDEIRRQFERLSADAKVREEAFSKKISHLEEQLNEKTKEAEHFKELYGKMKAAKPISPTDKSGVSLA